MAIAYRAGSWAHGTYAKGKELSVPKPAGVVAGDLMLLQVYLEPATLTPASTGWTLLSRTENAGAGFEAALFAKVYEGEAGPYLVTWGGAEHESTYQIAAYSGTAGIPTLDSGHAEASSTNAEATSITTTGANNLIVYMSAEQGGETYTQPTGMTARGELNKSFCTADVEQAVAGATGAKKGTLAKAAPTISQLVALEPEAAATITKPADQVSTQSVAITPVKVTGTHIATLTAKELPAGLELVKVSESEWLIEGTPTTPKAATTVTLEAKSHGGTGENTTLKWTVKESEAINKPADQVSTVSSPITPVAVTGTHLHTLVAKSLPTGLSLVKVSESEWLIEGTPTVVKGATTVTLEGTDTEGTLVTTTLQWTIAAVVVVGLTASVRQTVDVTVRAEVLDGVWETFGVDRAVQVDPETLVYSGNEWGPDKASFVLKRDPWAHWPDLSPYTPVEIEVGGQKTWEGRTNGTPLKAGSERQISVQCEGWQYHLDDGLYKRQYVHASLTDFKDTRSILTANLAVMAATPTVVSGEGAITLSFVKGATIIPGVAAGVTLDLGEAAAKTISCKYKTSNNATTVQLFVIGHDDPWWGADTEGVSREDFLHAEPIDPTENKTFSATITKARRYVTLLLWNTVETTPNPDIWVRIEELSIYSDSTFEAGNASVLKATTVDIDALEKAAPLISTDHSQIDTAADEFNIPSLVMASYRSPRQMIEAVNAFHNWLTMLDLERRLVVAPPDSEPLLEWGAWSGEQIEDISAGEGTDIYNEGVVEGAEPSGTVIDTVVTAEGIGESTILDKRGFKRAKAIGLSNATLPIVEQKIGEAWLRDQLTTPFAGSLKANVGSLRNIASGQNEDPSLISRHVNELLRVSQAIDPDTGGVGRDGRIVAYSYEHATRSALVTLGTRVDNVEALIARLGAVQEATS